ncbi:3-deoxy-D-manno-octulosonic acid transferase [Parvibaculum sp.]|uniref:3-deoxy-D-manno-octulosonic acid transferase n=1 Tax=Parvibaculum sp. TaxID=2024848 RepID=UPI003296F232
MTGKAPSLGLFFYRTMTRAVSPLVPLLLRRREARGKEDTARLGERLGVASRPRPDGPLVWLHGASVGESLSILPLVTRLLAARPGLHVLVTTGTVTSAKLMAERLPEGAVHQYVPLDHPDYCARFIDHWRPDLAIWIESEFWPNLIAATDRHGVPLALVNARITARSAHNWRHAPAFIADLLSRFRLIMAQDRASAARLRELGAAEGLEPGNLEHDAPALSVDKAELARLRAMTAGRTIWVATNTHEGEERAAGEAHTLLAASHPGLLTIVVPRHPARGQAIGQELTATGLSVARRATGDTITPATQIYLADTLGEVGLFYSLTDLVFIGGTFGDTGGHNPFEAARFGCALLAGPSDFNFAEAFPAFEEAGAMLRVANAASLAAAAARLLASESERRRMGAAAQRIASGDSGATERTLDALLALLPAPEARSANHA